VAGGNAVSSRAAALSLGDGTGVGLGHHLAITQRQTFERIVPALADYAVKWLLTEFVPLDDPRSQELLGDAIDAT